MVTADFWFCSTMEVLTSMAQSNQNFLCVEKFCCSKKISFPPLLVFIPPHVISIKTLSTLDVWSHCDKRTMWSHLSKCWSHDMRIANWYEKCKGIWKLQRHIKIANYYIGTIHQNVRIANWYESCKLTWKLQIDMKIAKQITWPFHRNDTVGMNIGIDGSENC